MQNRHAQTNGKEHLIVKYFCLFKLLFEWTPLIVSVSNSMLPRVETKSIKPGTKEPKMIFFPSSIWVMPDFWARQKGHDHNMERCLGFLFLFGFNLLTTDTPPLTRWPFSMVLQSSHTHRHTQHKHKHTQSHSTSIQEIKEKRQQIERRKRRVKRQDDLADAVCVT